MDSHAKSSSHGIAEPCAKHASILKSCNTLACIDCGFVNHCPTLAAGEKIICQRCKRTLKSLRVNWESRVSALIVTSIVLFICSNAFNFIRIDAGFQSQAVNLLSGVLALINNQQHLLAIMVLLTIFVFPLTELLTLSIIFIAKWRNKRYRIIPHLLKFLVHSRAWNMLDIFMVGVLITIIKLGETATIIPGSGLICFACLIITLIIINLNLNFHALWDWYRSENYFSHSDDQQFYACSTCHATVGKQIIQHHGKCPRCGSYIRHRKRNSLQKTTALLISAAILYIPAMTLPITSISSFGRESQDTILSGVVAFVDSGQWFIAVVIFVASILVPIFKLLVLSYLLWSVRQQSSHKPLTRQRLFALTEWVGRWSMIDVFVITLLVALVQFGIIMNVRPEPAALAFAAVVILTMIAVETFDSRLLWDNTEITTTPS